MEAPMFNGVPYCFMTSIVEKLEDLISVIKELSFKQRFYVFKNFLNYNQFISNNALEE